MVAGCSIEPVEDLSFVRKECLGSKMTGPQYAYYYAYKFPRGNEREDMPPPVCLYRDDYDGHMERIMEFKFDLEIITPGAIVDDFLYLGKGQEIYKYDLSQKVVDEPVEIIRTNLDDNVYIKDVISIDGNIAKVRLFYVLGEHLGSPENVTKTEEIELLPIK